MTGSVMKKPVQYTAEGAWMLDGQFLAFHMVDAAVPPAYEATLYIGIDSSRKEYVAHWLDTFGGAGARVVGLGPLSGKSIEIVYPYAEGAFRNSLAFDPVQDRWTLLIQAQDSTGHWSDFADYTIARQR